MFEVLTQRRRANRVSVIRWIALCFLGGSLINVGVTWWLALRGAYIYTLSTSISINIRPDGEPPWETEFSTCTGYRPGFQFERIGEPGSSDTFDWMIAQRISAEQAAEESGHNGPWLMGANNVVMPPMTWPQWLEFPEDDGVNYSLWEGRASGWPMLSMCSVVFARSRSMSKESEWQLQIFDPKLYGRTADANPGSIPLRPIPFGFFVNSLFYSLAFAPIAVMFELRRRKLQVEHACTHCGYSLAGLPQSASCPECNTPISAAAYAGLSTR